MKLDELTLLDRFFWASKVPELTSPYHELVKAIDAGKRQRVSWLLQERPDALCAVGEIEYEEDGSGGWTEHAPITFRGEELIARATEHGHLDIAETLGNTVKQYPKDGPERAELLSHFGKGFMDWYSKTRPMGSSSSNTTNISRIAAAVSSLRR